MSDASDVKRLVTFLGYPQGGSYSVTKYVQGDLSLETKFVAEALSRFLKPTEVHVMATDKVWKAVKRTSWPKVLSPLLKVWEAVKLDINKKPQQGEELEARLKKCGVATVCRHRIPDGQTEDELWEQFGALLDSLDVDEGAIALDITHGFRSQPFFAAGTVMFTHLTQRASRDIRVYYGAFEQVRNDPRSKIWDLTPFIQLVAWSTEIMLFLRTGRAEGLAEATRNLGRALAKDWAVAGKQGDRPKLDRLADALGAFGDDLETIRTGSLLLGAAGAGSATRRLLDELAAVRSDPSIDRIPPLKTVLDQIEERVKPLDGASTLSDAAGARAVAELAKLYIDMGRYSEATATLREAAVNQFADDRSNCPGQVTYCERSRGDAEERWRESSKTPPAIVELRNDVQHAGYRGNPMPAQTIKRILKERLAEGPVQPSG